MSVVDFRISISSPSPVAIFDDRCPVVPGLVSGAGAIGIVEIDPLKDLSRPGDIESPVPTEFICALARNLGLTVHDQQAASPMVSFGKTLFARRFGRRREHAHKYDRQTYGDGCAHVKSFIRRLLKIGLTGGAYIPRRDAQRQLSPVRSPPRSADRRAGVKVQEGPLVGSSPTGKNAPERTPPQPIVSVSRFCFPGWAWSRGQRWPPSSADVAAARPVRQRRTQSTSLARPELPTAPQGRQLACNRPALQPIQSLGSPTHRVVSIPKP
jgi:hypothetical protein